MAENRPKLVAPFNVQDEKVTNVATPTDPTDAANMAYVDGRSVTITVGDEGMPLTGGAETLNFRGDGVEATNDPNDPSEKIIEVTRRTNREVLELLNTNDGTLRFNSNLIPSVTAGNIHRFTTETSTTEADAIAAFINAFDLAVDGQAGPGAGDSTFSTLNPLDVIIITYNSLNTIGQFTYIGLMAAAVGDKIPTEDIVDFLSASGALSESVANGLFLQLSGANAIMISSAAAALIRTGLGLDDITNYPILNQDTTGNAATVTAIETDATDAGHRVPFFQDLNSGTLSVSLEYDDEFTWNPDSHTLDVENLQVDTNLVVGAGITFSGIGGTGPHILIDQTTGALTRGTIGGGSGGDFAISAITETGTNITITSSNTIQNPVSTRAYTDIKDGNLRTQIIEKTFSSLSDVSSPTSIGATGSSLSTGNTFSNAQYILNDTIFVGNTRRLSFRVTHTGTVPFTNHQRIGSFSSATPTGTDTPRWSGEIVSVDTVSSTIKDVVVFVDSGDSASFFTTLGATDGVSFDILDANLTSTFLNVFEVLSTYASGSLNRATDGTLSFIDEPTLTEFNALSHTVDQHEQELSDATAPNQITTTTTTETSVRSGNDLFGAFSGYSGTFGHGVLNIQRSSAFPTAVNALVRGNILANNDNLATAAELSFVGRTERVGTHQISFSAHNAAATTLINNNVTAGFINILTNQQVANVLNNMQLVVQQSSTSTTVTPGPETGVISNPSGLLERRDLATSGSTGGATDIATRGYVDGNESGFSFSYDLATGNTVAFEEQTEATVASPVTATVAALAVATATSIQIDNITGSPDLVGATFDVTSGGTTTPFTVVSTQASAGNITILNLNAGLPEAIAEDATISLTLTPPDERELEGTISRVISVTNANISAVGSDSLFEIIGLSADEINDITTAGINGGNSLAIIPVGKRVRFIGSVQSPHPANGIRFRLHTKQDDSGQITVDSTPNSTEVLDITTEPSLDVTTDNVSLVEIIDLRDATAATDVRLHSAISNDTFVPNAISVGSVLEIQPVSGESFLNQNTGSYEFFTGMDMRFINRVSGFELRGEITAIGAEFTFRVDSIHNLPSNPGASTTGLFDFIPEDYFSSLNPNGGLIDTNGLEINLNPNGGLSLVNGLGIVATEAASEINSDYAIYGEPDAEGNPPSGQVAVRTGTDALGLFQRDTDETITLEFTTSNTSDPRNRFDLGDSGFVDITSTPLTVLVDGVAADRVLSFTTGNQYLVSGTEIVLPVASNGQAVQASFSGVDIYFGQRFNVHYLFNSTTYNTLINTTPTDVTITSVEVVLGGVVWATFSGDEIVVSNTPKSLSVLIGPGANLTSIILSEGTNLDTFLREARPILRFNNNTPGAEALLFDIPQSDRPGSEITIANGHGIEVDNGTFSLAQTGNQTITVDVVESELELNSNPTIISIENRVEAIQSQTGHTFHSHTVPHWGYPPYPGHLTRPLDPTSPGGLFTENDTNQNRAWQNITTTVTGDFNINSLRDGGIVVSNYWNQSAFLYEVTPMVGRHSQGGFTFRQGDTRIDNFGPAKGLVSKLETLYTWDISVDSLYEGSTGGNLLTSNYQFRNNNYRDYQIGVTAADRNVMYTLGAPDSAGPGRTRHEAYVIVAFGNLLTTAGRPGTETFDSQHPFFFRRVWSTANGSSAADAAVGQLDYYECLNGAFPQDIAFGSGTTVQVFWLRRTAGGNGQFPRRVETAGGQTHRVGIPLRPQNINGTNYVDTATDPTTGQEYSTANGNANLAHRVTDFRPEKTLEQGLVVFPEADTIREIKGHLSEERREPNGLTGLTTQTYSVPLRTEITSLILPDGVFASRVISVTIDDTTALPVTTAPSGNSQYRLVGNRNIEVFPSGTNAIVMVNYSDTGFQVAGNSQPFNTDYIFSQEIELSGIIDPAQPITVVRANGQPINTNLDLPDRISLRGITVHSEDPHTITLTWSHDTTDDHDASAPEENAERFFVSYNTRAIGWDSISVESTQGTNPVNPTSILQVQTTEAVDNENNTELVPKIPLALNFTTDAQELADANARLTHVTEMIANRHPIQYLRITDDAFQGDTQPVIGSNVVLQELWEINDFRSSIDLQTLLFSRNTSIYGTTIDDSWISPDLTRDSEIVTTIDRTVSLDNNNHSAYVIGATRTISNVENVGRFALDMPVFFMTNNFVNGNSGSLFNGQVNAVDTTAGTLGVRITEIVQSVDVDALPAIGEQTWTLGYGAQGAQGGATNASTLTVNAATAAGSQNVLFSDGTGTGEMISANGGFLYDPVTHSVDIGEENTTASPVSNAGGAIRVHSDTTDRVTTVTGDGITVQGLIGVGTRPIGVTSLGALTTANVPGISDFQIDGTAEDTINVTTGTLPTNNTPVVFGFDDTSNALTGSIDNSAFGATNVVINNTTESEVRISAEILPNNPINVVIGFDVNNNLTAAIDGDTVGGGSELRVDNVVFDRPNLQDNPGVGGVQFTATAGATTTDNDNIVGVADLGTRVTDVTEGASRGILTVTTTDANGNTNPQPVRSGQIVTAGAELATTDTSGTEGDYHLITSGTDTGRWQERGATTWQAPYAAPTGTTPTNVGDFSFSGSTVTTDDAMDIRSNNGSVTIEGITIDASGAMTATTGVGITISDIADATEAQDVVKIENVIDIMCYLSFTAPAEMAVTLGTVPVTRQAYTNVVGLNGTWYEFPGVTITSGNYVADATRTLWSNNVDPQAVGAQTILK